MASDLKQKVQLVLVIAIAIAATRAGYVLYERHVDQIDQAKQKPVALNPDYYVTPKKLHPYDLKSAQQLTKQSVWVKEGYRYTFYPYDTARHGTAFTHEAGQLGPIEKLQITQVVTDSTPGLASQRQVMAVFEKDGKAWAFPIGSISGGDYKIYSDEMLYIQDPHELYSHWPADVWDAVANHAVKPGMNELQADFAIGMGIPEPSGNPAVKTVNYPNGGKPVSITYRDGRAAEIKGQS